LQEHNKTKKKGLKGDSKKGGKGKQGGKGRDADKGNRIMTANVLKNGKQVCKPFNDPRGCRMKGCSREHACDVLKPNGEVCGNRNHNRLEHR
jgi:hypothetical protein